LREGGGGRWERKREKGKEGELSTAVDEREGILCGIYCSLTDGVEA